MRTLTVLAAVCVLVLATAGDAAARKSSEGSRPYYGGGKHSQSHGGDYQGGRGSSHKGGEYRNPASGDRYGKHKP